MLIGEHTIGDPPGVGDSYVTNTTSYTMDQFIVFTGVEPLEPEGFRYSLNRNAGLYLMDHLTQTFDMLYAGSKINVPKTYSISTSLLKSLASLSMDVILRPSYESTVASTSVIDALVWSYAEIFDEIWRQMETMSTALKLEYAQGSDLDDAWGQIYDLPRMVSEDDTSYRDRLKTRTIILNGSGTKANCEVILDSIIGLSSSTITTRYPASVDITFDTIDAMRIAKEKLSTLNILIPQMLAHGISYNIFLPFSDYIMDCIMKGAQTLPFNIFMALNMHNIDITFEIVNTLLFQFNYTYDTDLYLQESHNKSFVIGNRLTKFRILSYIIDQLLINTETIGLEVHSNIRKDAINRTYNVDQYMLKYNNIYDYTIDNVTSKSRHQRHNMEITLV